MELRVNDNSLQAVTQQLIGLQQDYARVQDDLAAAELRESETIVHARQWQQRALAAESIVRAEQRRRFQERRDAEAAEDEDDGEPRAQAARIAIEDSSDDSDED
tara:strand:+ start:1340 stop:1651 length:312 start_codon:yes stop_codon:yes gene_type:complete